MLKLKIIAVSLLLGGVSLGYAYDDGDFQVWNTEAQEKKISQNFKLAAEEEFRWADNANDFYYHHYDLGLIYSLNEHLNLSVGYRHIFEKKTIGSSTKFKVENEPYITAALSWDFAGFKFESRNRIEYRHFDYQADSGRYRNKFNLKFPWKLTGFKFLAPYLADEIFFGFGGTNQFNQNRFSSGFGMNLIKEVSAEIYYMLQSTKSKGKWTDANIFGTKVKLIF
jgi:hypothetical protein